MALRSGQRFQARNQPYYNSVRELLSVHERLIQDNPAVTQQQTYIDNVGQLTQTTIRFPITSTRIRASIRSIFQELLRQKTPQEHYEVVITFNAILFSPTENTYSLFYGHDFRSNNAGGRAPELNIYDQAILINSAFDVEQIPIQFDYDQLVHNHRDAFHNSSVVIHSFVNIIYLVYKYIPHRHGRA